MCRNRMTGASTTEPDRERLLHLQAVILCSAWQGTRNVGSSIAHSVWRDFQ